MALKIMSVVGARPNFMKIAPIIEEIRGAGIDHILVHTGQHYSSNMSDRFFEDLQLPEPDINLNAGSTSHAKQTADIMSKLEDVLIQQKPSLVLLVGDVNSTLAASLTAAKLRIRIAHVEAGLRSFDFDMPEEINRVVTDRISDLLFCTEQSGMDNLKNEGIDNNKIFLVGNVMIDSLIKNIDAAKKSVIAEELDLKDDFCVVTAHRPENVDSEQNLRILFSIIKELQEKIKVIYPIHPRTMKMLKQFGFDKSIEKMKNLKLIEPLGYINFLKLVLDSKFVVTDSGGLQEETSYLGIPCLTIRRNTERPVTVEKGTNTVTGLNKDNVILEVEKILKGVYKKGSRIELWDGHAAERIVKILLEGLK